MLRDLKTAWVEDLKEQRLLESYLTFLLNLPGYHLSDRFLVLTVLRVQGRGDGVAVNRQELDSAAYNMMDLLRSIADSIDPATIDPDLYWSLSSVEEGSWWGLK